MTLHCCFSLFLLLSNHQIHVYMSVMNSVTFGCSLYRNHFICYCSNLC
uniref:Uncharacterized protein n=1 Tax=Arundo donax TaxID=35708 RepID=A0A0A9QHT1_ARUDO